jgi:hypothetical protein
LTGRPGSSIRSRSVGGTKRPGGVTGSAGGGGSATRRGSGAATGGSGITGGGSTTTATGGAAGSAATEGAATGGSSTCCSATTTGRGSSASTGGGAGVGGGACGLIVLTRRGGPKTGAVGFGGSAFLTAVAFFPPFAGAGTSANMSPLGSAMLRCRATRSTKERATTSSMVLDALFNSMPWSRLSSARTSWLVEPINSATL